MGVRIFAWLLRLLPHALRDEFGDAMRADAMARSPSNGAAGRARYWLREWLGLVRVAVGERLAAPGKPKDTGRRSPSMAETIVRELRFAVRRLIRTPAFSALSVLTLALAFGAVLAVWTVVKHVVVDPLPYPDSDRLVVLEHGLPAVGAPSGVATNRGLYMLYRDDARRLESAALTQRRELTLTGLGDPERLPAAAVTPGFLRVLQMEPVLGRWFEADAGREGGPREVVLSHALWSTRFGGDRGVPGRTIELSGEPWQVIGVLPDGVAFPADGVMLWLPMEEPALAPGMGGFNYDAVARMVQGVDVEMLRGELNALVRDRLIARFPESEIALRLLDDAGLVTLPRTLKDREVGGIARTMWVLLATVGLVLVIACANVANLTLVRAEARQTEVLVRRALGAGGAGIFTMHLAESLVLAVTGGAIGMLLSAAGVAVLRSRAPAQLPRVDEIAVDASVLVVGIVATLVVAIGLACVPLLRARSRTALSVAAGRRLTSDAARTRARSLLMTVQVALACVLLVACGLMVRSFLHLNRVDPGFSAENVLSFEVSVPVTRYPADEDAVLFHTTLRERLESLPGVSDAAIVTCPPLGGWCWGDPLRVEGREDSTTPQVVAMRWASNDYFGTLRVPVLAGRGFEEGDENRQVAVINRALARSYFGDEDPVGRRLAPAYGGAPWMTVVGVVENTAALSVTETLPAPQVFFPAGSVPGEVSIPQHAYTYVIRTEGAPAALLPSIRSALRDLDPAVAIANVTTLEQEIAESGARIAFTMVLLSVAAFAALLLGAIGIYGVVSFSVSRRTGEIGVRLALGARARDVVLMVVRQGAIATLAGLVIGLGAAVAFARFMGAILFGVEPTDPLTYVAVASALFSLALAASWLPARRAVALDPAHALRAE